MSVSHWSNNSSSSWLSSSSSSSSSSWGTQNFEFLDAVDSCQIHFPMWIKVVSQIHLINHTWEWFFFFFLNEKHLIKTMNLFKTIRPKVQYVIYGSITLVIANSIFCWQMRLVLTSWYITQIRILLPISFVIDLMTLPK